MVPFFTGSFKVQTYALLMILVVAGYKKNWNDAVLGHVFSLRNVSYVEEKVKKMFTRSIQKCL